MNDKYRIMQLLDELKRDTMTEIDGIIEDYTNNSKYNNGKSIREIVIKRFTEIMQNKGIRVDTAYLDGELNVLLSEIQKSDKRQNEDLRDNINHLLRKHVELSVETSNEDNDLKRNESRTMTELDENQSQRKRNIDNKNVQIEDYIYNIFSHTMKMLEMRAISITQKERDELSYEVLSILKHKTTDKMTEIFDSNNSELLGRISTILSEFFETVNHELKKQQESEESKTKKDSERKPWELTPKEAKNINVEAATEEARRKAEERGIAFEPLPENVLD